ncbi:membrane associated rhomboid family serine protease [Bradyrhizobium sp. USDA 326]|uniref:rhomboid family intramembrane serine protease n=1 Tax=unclassified Bradyrhizobium TaxID=2631580 RepID=UPI00351948CB
MPSYRASPGFFEVPHAAVYVLMTVTILASGFCFILAGGASAPAELLYRFGGMYATAIARHEYLRLVAYGFLHVDFVHLTMNMLCLVLWGAHLERRVGPAYFLIIYLCAMVFGAVIGNGIHSTPYLTVGASGATSGILGALLCLWILGKHDVGFDFFAINIGLNIAFALGNSRIDWGVHLGGFAAGLITCALLDLVEKANAWTLRCKFPEVVKVNLTLLAFVIALWAWGGPAQSIATGLSAWGLMVVIVVACCAVVKMVDLALSMKKGLAVVVPALAGVNAAAVLLCGWALAFACWPHMPIGYIPLDLFLVIFCPNSILISGLAAVGVAALTLFLGAKEIFRGIADVGFVGTSLRAERSRRHGL